MLAISLFLAFDFKTLNKILSPFILFILIISVTGYLNNFLFSLFNTHNIFLTINGVILVFFIILALYVMFKKIDPKLF